MGGDLFRGGQRSLDGYRRAGGWPVNNPRTVARLSIASVFLYLLAIIGFWLAFRAERIPVVVPDMPLLVQFAWWPGMFLVVVVVHEGLHWLAALLMGRRAKVRLWSKLGPYTFIPGRFNWREAATLNLYPAVIASLLFGAVAGLVRPLSGFALLAAAMNVAASLGDFANVLEFAFLPRGALSVVGEGEEDGLWVPVGKVSQTSGCQQVAD